MAGRHLIVCILVGSIGFAHAGTWNQATPFADTGNGDPDVVFFSSNSANTRIQLTEERGDVQIAKINYEGIATDPPIIISFDDGNDNTMLGAEHQLIGSEWYLVIKNPQDYEVDRQQKYGFRYATGFGGGHLVQLSIKNINDNAPDISPENSNCLIVENVIYPSSDCTFIVRDNDGGAEWPFRNMEYHINTTTNQHFGLKYKEDIDAKSARAELTVGDPGLDFEEFSVHITSLFVNDHPTDGNIGTTTYVVKVEDVADEPPIWTTPIVPQNLLEEEPHEVQVNAVDGDVGINADIGYRLEFSQVGDEDYFSIDGNGLISVKVIDRDILESDIFLFTVVAYEIGDVASLVSSEMFVIIKDINDNEPTITSPSLAISIDEEIAVQLDLDITILDPDLADNGTFTIELQDSTSGHNWHENFLLIPKNGYQSSLVTISVSKPEVLDYENPQMRVITLQLVTIEKGDSSHRDSRDIVITLRDLNDEFPYFSPDDGAGGYIASIEENSKMGTHIKTVLASDPDAGDVVTHSLTSQGTIMNIDGLTGEIKVASDTSFDYERQTTVVVQVMARDLADHTTFVQLTITVIDVNDVQPDLTMPVTQPNITENSVVGDTIDAEILASDVDTTAVLVFSIDWAKCFATKQGARVQDTSLFEDSIEIITEFPVPSDTGKASGKLRVKNNILDYEAYDTLTLSIVVTDSKTEPEYPQSLSRSALLAIQLNDENDNKPIFTEDSVSAERSVIEEALTNWLIGSVIATDADGPGNNVVTYTMTEADPLLPPNLVKIDPIKGELRVDLNRGIDCDAAYKDKMLYTVTASDGFWDTDLTISINIIDVNDNIPQYTVDPAPIRILENSTSGFDIIDVIGNDLDFTRPYYTISFFMSPYLNPPEMRDLFAINENTGKLTVEINTALSGGLDRDEGFTFYEIPILLRDNYNQSDAISAISQYNDTLRIRVELIDINDNPPILEVIDGCIDQLLDEVAVGTAIRPEGILATDKDEGENARVTFSIVSVNRRPDGTSISPPDPENLFDISNMDNSNRGYLTTKASVKNFWGIYEVELMGTDNPIPPEVPLTGTRTYQVCILAMNDHDPEIVYPAVNESIRILMQQTVGGALVDAKNITLRDFFATDADIYGDNAKVDLTLEGNALAMEYFTLVQSTVVPNSAQLRLRKDLNDRDRVFQLQILATDNGIPKKTDQVSTKLVVMNRQDVEPTFQIKQHDVYPWFVENDPDSTTMLPIAIDEDNFELSENDPEWQTIYYFLIGTKEDSPGLDHFIMNRDSGELSLRTPLDREAEESHTLYVLATNSLVNPNEKVDNSSESQLIVIVKVQDTNDNPPQFQTGFYLGGVGDDYSNGDTITTILAIDPDLNNTISYSIVEGTMSVSHPSLESLVANEPFLLLGPPGGNEGRATLILNFKPTATMVGSFEFNVTVHDEMGPVDNHQDFAQMKIYMITADNRVTFTFNNPLKAVDDQRLEVQDVFTKYLIDSCSIDKIILDTDSNGIPKENVTLVHAHFINVNESEPVHKNEIAVKVNDRNTAAAIRNAFLIAPFDPPLDFVDFSNIVIDSKNMEELLKIILIVVSVVLGTLVILLFAAFFFKTRSLNRRLEALSTTKFGSQDSGLNRVGMSMPGANKRALEGSNPVWNEDIHAKDFDAVSQGSYESGMIGIEDNPEFNTQAPRGQDNIAYNMESRPSINPLSNGALNAPPEYVEVNPTGQDSNFTFSNNNDDTAMDF